MTFGNAGVYKDDESGCTYHPGQAGWAQVMHPDRDQPGSVPTPQCGEINKDNGRRRVCSCRGRATPTGANPNTASGTRRRLSHDENRITFSNRCEARRAGHAEAEIVAGTCEDLYPPVTTAAPVACPAVEDPVCVTHASVAPPTNFFLADGGETCDEACGRFSDTCDADKLADAASSVTRCKEILTTLGKTF